MILCLVEYVVLVYSRFVTNWYLHFLYLTVPGMTKQYIRDSQWLQVHIIVALYAFRC